MTDPLIALAERARSEPIFFAYALEAYASANRLDDAGLCAALGCAPADLLMIRLCRTPRTDGAGLREDMDLLAARFHLDLGRVRGVVKRAMILAAQRGSLRGANEPGCLIAARDREEQP